MNADPIVPFSLTVLTLVVALALAPGCRDREPREEPPEPSSLTGDRPQSAEPSAPAGAVERLERAVGLTFGLPLPNGLELVERDADVALFRSLHAFDRLVAFYDHELPEHIRSDRADGTKYEPPGGDGTAVFLVTTASSVRVVYVREAVDLSALEIVPTPPPDDPASAEPLSFESGFPWPQGLHIPADYVDRVIAAHGRRNGPAGGGLFYVERFEEVDGERVRVLTLREQPGDSLLAGNDDSDSGIEMPELWHRLPRRPGGSYDRGNGERSLRPSPELDDEGRPKPFFGTQRLEIDRRSVRH